MEHWRGVERAAGKDGVPFLQGMRLPAGAPPRAPNRRRSATTTAAELAERGIPSSAVRNWLMERVLLRTAVRGTYRVTPETEERIARYLDRKRGGRAARLRPASRR